MLASDWYKERLLVKQRRDTELWRRHIAALEKCKQTVSGPCDFNVEERLHQARAKLSRVSSPDYLKELRGTIGADPFHCQIPTDTRRVADLS